MLKRVMWAAIAVALSLPVTSLLRHSTAAPTLVCWGSNRFDEDGGYVDHKLGPGAADLPYSAVPVPVPVPGGAQVLHVGMSSESTYAVAVDGLTYAWGLNNRRQLGTAADDPVIATPSPVMIVRETELPVPLRGAGDVLRSPGSDQCAKLQDLSLFARYVCWGTDDHGELGLGRAGGTEPLAKPTTVLPSSAANMVHGEDHACVTVTVNERVEIWCYGLGSVVGNGSIDPAMNQFQAAPIVWDPSNFRSAREP